MTAPIAKQYKDAITGETVTLVRRLNHCGVTLQREDGTEYTSCFCSLLAL